MHRSPKVFLASFGTLALSLALSYGCSSDDEATAPSDAGNVEATAADRKVTTTPDAAGAVDAAVTCEPQDVSAFAPNWQPPAPMRAGRCSPSQAATFSECSYGHAGYDQAKCAAFNAAPANADCIACAGGATVATAGSTNVNYGGCVAHLTGDKSTTGCGAKIQAAEQCQRAACEKVCPIAAGNDAQFKAYTKCLDDAWTDVCGSFSSATSCADDFRKGTGPGAACYPNTTDFGVIIRTYVDFFCASPAGDGGTDAASDGPHDATSGG